MVTDLGLRKGKGAGEGVGPGQAEAENVVAGLAGDVVEERCLVGAKRVRLVATHLDGKVGAKKGVGCSVHLIHGGVGFLALEGIRGIVVLVLAFCLISIVGVGGGDGVTRSGSSGDDGLYVVEGLIERFLGGGDDMLYHLLDQFRRGGGSRVHVHGRGGQKAVVVVARLHLHATDATFVFLRDIVVAAMGLKSALLGGLTDHLHVLDGVGSVVCGLDLLCYGDEAVVEVLLIVVDGFGPVHLISLEGDFDGLLDPISGELEPTAGDIEDSEQVVIALVEREDHALREFRA